MGRGQKEERRRNVATGVKILGAQIGQGKAQGLTMHQMIGGGSQTAAAKKVFAKGALKAGLKGMGAGVAVVTAAHEGFKAGRKIKKKVKGQHKKKISAQETEQAKNRARAAQIKYEKENAVQK